MSYALLLDDYEQTGRGTRYAELPLNNQPISLEPLSRIVVQLPQHADYRKSAQFEKTLEIIEPDSYLAVRVTSVTYQDELEFSALAQQWKQETRHASFVRQQITHPAFLQILVMSKRALPMLIREIKTAPRRWLLPLRLIAKSNPVKEGASMDEAVKAWSDWWDRNKDRYG